MIAEFIGVKVFSLEKSLGLEPARLVFWDGEAYGFNMTAGVLVWPLAFVLTDVVNEYFGRRGVRRISFFTAALILYAFLLAVLAIGLEPAAFWQTDPATGADQQTAFRLMFGQGAWIIVGSLAAFLIGQFADVTVFHQIRRLTGDKALWLRATGSTLVSQLIDSFVVLYVAFYLKPDSDWTFARLISVASVNYLYKFFVAIALTPLLYVLHAAIDRWLGEELASELIRSARGRA